VSGRNQNGKASGGRKRRLRYARSTPVGRLLKNIVKMRKVAAVTLARMSSWGGDPALAAAEGMITDADARLGDAFGRMVTLEKAGWTPPKKRSVVVFEEGEQVQIAEKHRKKYLSVYGRDVVDSLVVSKILDSGELAVKHGRAMPFIVSKSHVERRRVVNGAKSR